jgi:DNA-binding MurR/RpiR family transcriptional regulator
MERDVLSVLQEKMSEFSKSQRLIAQYIMDCYDKAAFMTANRLGKTVGVSESTVVRFAAELGFDGYPDMQKAMQEMVVNRLTSVQRMEVANDRIGDQDVVSMVLQADMEKLRQIHAAAFLYRCTMPMILPDKTTVTSEQQIRLTGR